LRTALIEVCVAASQMRADRSDSRIAIAKRVSMCVIEDEIRHLIQTEIDVCDAK
jgi:hypothetical protein